jgi:hypothetical protein
MEQLHTANPIIENSCEMRLNNLMELLSIQTLRLAQLLIEKKIYCPEYEECKNAIHQLSAEIEVLKNTNAVSYYQYNQPGAARN